VSSPAALLLDLGVIHSSFCGSARKFSGWLAGWSRKISNYCGGEKILPPPRFQHCGGERPRCPRGSDAFDMDVEGKLMVDLALIRLIIPELL